MYKVKITSQGQISIPAVLRKKYGLKANSKAFIRDNNGNMVIEPSFDFLSLAGSLHDKAITNKSIDEIIEMEEKVAENMFSPSK